MQSAHLSFSWPDAPPQPFHEEFFWGVWHASARLHVEYDTPPSNVSPIVISGHNFFLVSNDSTLHHGAGLVHSAAAHSSQTRLNAIAFRGYVVEPPVHGWSATADVCAYWSRDLPRSHNGIFAAARITARELEFVTDAFGISPLYYRECSNGLVLFATAPRYLCFPGDGVDPLAARMLLHRYEVGADASLVPGVQRCKPGHVIRFDGTAKTERPWFAFDRLPVGSHPITPAGVEAAEEAFQVAMNRCLRLMPATEHHLPFSSGHDSRRILVALLERKIPFQAITMRLRNKQYRDLDGRFTAEMAAALGFPHEVHELVPPRQYGLDDRLIRLLFSSELSEHAWMPEMIRHFRPHASLVFDGLGGDIFGNTGFAIPDLHRIPEGSKLDQLPKAFLPDTADSPFRRDAFVPLEAARAVLADQFRILPDAPNTVDYAFVLTRARRGVGPAMQYLPPAGYVTVYPYFDLDHIQVTMQLDSLDKIKQTLQSRCLEAFWPQYLAFPGSRRIPPDIPEGPAEFKLSRVLACTDQMRSECYQPSILPEARSILPLSRHFQAVAAGVSRTLKHRIKWWLDPVLMILSAQRQAQPCWRIAEKETAGPPPVTVGQQVIA
jgi:hypothetical protein